MSCKPPHCNKQRDSAAMTGESAFPWHEYLPEPLPAAEIIVRLIEEAMAQTGSDDSTDQKRIEKRIKKSLRNPFPLEEPLEYEPSEDETRDEKQRIPPERNRSDAEYLRIYMPVYHQCLKHSLSFLNHAKITFRRGFLQKTTKKRSGNPDLHITTGVQFITCG